MMERLSLEVVILAEQVLQRLLHERKTLENVGLVLQTYKQSIAELQTVEKEIVAARELLLRTQEETAALKTQQGAVIEMLLKIQRAIGQ